MSGHFMDKARIFKCIPSPIVGKVSPIVGKGIRIIWAFDEIGLHWIGLHWIDSVPFRFNELTQDPGVKTIRDFILALL